MRSLRPGWLSSLTVGLALAACSGNISIQPPGASHDADAGGTGVTTISGTTGAGGTTTTGAGGTTTTGAGGTATTGAGGTTTTGAGGTATGAGGSTTTTGTGGTAGIGGSTTGTTLSCSTLLVDEPLVPLLGIPGGHQYAPTLAALEPDGSRVGLLYDEHASAFVNLVVRVASIALQDPWGAWPASIGPPISHGLFTYFAAGPSQDGRFSMLTYDLPNGVNMDPQGMIVWGAPAGMPGAEGQSFDDIAPGLPTLVASNGGRYLAGFQEYIVGAPTFSQLSLAVITMGDASSSSFDPSFTCGVGPLLAGAAMPLGGGFLAALSNGRPFGTCLTNELADAPPSRLQIMTIGDDVSQAVLTFEHDEPNAYANHVRTVPAGDGAWVAWERTDLVSPPTRRIQLVRVDGAGFPVNGNVLEVGFGVNGLPFGVASMGPFVGIATRIQPGAMQVSVISSEGALVNQAVIGGVPPGMEMDGVVTVVGSPTGQMLVAWGEISTTATDKRIVRLARVRCAGP